MTLDGIAVVMTLLVQTGIIVWWGATLTATVKQHEKKLLDHEERLREGTL